MRDREKTIAHVMDYCQHYTPDSIFGRGGVKATGLCAAGVKVAEVRTGQDRMQPCVGGHKHTNPTSVCPKWIRKTREQGEKRHDELEEAMRKHRLVGPVVAEWRKKPPRGKQEVIECPACKGRLHLSQASSNGHVWGHCETSGCVSWME